MRHPAGLPPRPKLPTEAEKHLWDQRPKSPADLEAERILAREPNISAVEMCRRVKALGLSWLVLR